MDPVMTFEEIAAELGWTVVAVMTTYRRAIAKLRRNPEARALWGPPQKEVAL